MSIDMKSLQAFADTEEPSGDLEEEMMADAEGEEGDGAEPALSEDLLSKYGEAIEALEDAGPALEGCLEYLSEEALASEEELSDEDADAIVTIAADDIPPTALEVIQKHLKGIPWADAQKLGEHLEAEGYITSGAAVGGLLFHVAHSFE